MMGNETADEDKKQVMEEDTAAGDQDTKEKKKDMDHKDNVISDSDMDYLEKKEEHNKGFFDKIFGSKEKTLEGVDASFAEDDAVDDKLSDDVSDSAGSMTMPSRDDLTESAQFRQIQKEIDSEATKEENLLIKIEKLEGKLETEAEQRSGLSDRILNLSEEMGELRSMILSREKIFNDMDVTFEKMKDMVHEVKPEKIKFNLEKKEEHLLELDARAERFDSLLKEMGNEIKNYRQQMSHIKSFDNLESMYDKIQNNLKKIDESKNFIDVKTSKVEQMFSDFNTHSKDFARAAVKVQSFDEMVKDFMKTMEQQSVTIKESAKASDIEKIKASVEELGKNMQNVNNRTAKLQALDKIDINTVDELVNYKIQLNNIFKSFVSLKKDNDFKINALKEIIDLFIEDFNSKTPDISKVNTLKDRLDNLSKSPVIIKRDMICGEDMFRPDSVLDYSNKNCAALNQAPSKVQNAENLSEHLLRFNEIDAKINDLIQKHNKNIAK